MSFHNRSRQPQTSLLPPALSTSICVSQWRRTTSRASRRVSLQGLGVVSPFARARDDRFSHLVPRVRSSSPTALRDNLDVRGVLQRLKAALLAEIGSVLREGKVSPERRPPPCPPLPPILTLAPTSLPRSSLDRRLPPSRTTRTPSSPGPPSPTTSPPRGSTRRSPSFAPRQAPTPGRARGKTRRRSRRGDPRSRGSSSS